MIINHGCSEVVSYTRTDGSTYSRPLLHGTPKIVFKTECSPLQIRFRFACPFEDCYCSKSPRERQLLRLRGIKTPGCPFRRHIKFLDSCLIIPCSLSQMVTDLHKARTKEGKSMESMFPSTFRYAQSQGMSTEQFSCLTDGK